MTEAAEAAASMTGIERIGAAFDGARAEGRSAALMPYVMGGFPDREASRAIVEAYADSGADLIELGVPFSDPLADGPVIHDAATRALAEGADLGYVLELGALVADRVPVVLMVYANMVLARGAERFAADLAAAGLAGAIVPDLPPEEAGEVRDRLAESGMALIPLVAPTTPPVRRRMICGQATGFVYLVSDTRTTGERAELPPELGELAAAVRADSPVPVAVGFGIGTPEQAAAVGSVADGVIIGSRLVRAADEGGAAEVAEFIAAARAALAG